MESVNVALMRQKVKKDSKNPVNLAYAEIVFEILKRTNVKVSNLARDINAQL